MTLWLADRDTADWETEREAAHREAAYREAAHRDAGHREPDHREADHSEASDVTTTHPYPEPGHQESAQRDSTAPWLIDDEVPPLRPALGPYRAAVSDLVTEIGECTDSDAQCAEHILSKRLDEDELAMVLEATPDGWDATATRLLFEVRNFQPSTRNATASIASLVRISMLAQIDAVWWGRAASYQQDLDVLEAAELVDLDQLDGSGRLRFTYRHQAETLLSRAARSAERRTLPGRSPRTAGLSTAKARPQVVAWLNQIATQFSEIAPEGTPPLWVTSVARSVEHQKHLKSLGYIALLPSAHCVGYAADLEMKWYRRFHAHRLLRGLLLDHQRAGEVNVIDEGQAWHVCLSPDVVTGPRMIPGPRPHS